MVAKNGIYSKVSQFHYYQIWQGAMIQWFKSSILLIFVSRTHMAVYNNWLIPLPGLAGGSVPVTKIAAIIAASYHQPEDIPTVYCCFGKYYAMIIFWITFETHSLHWQSTSLISALNFSIPYTCDYTSPLYSHYTVLLAPKRHNGSYILPVRAGTLSHIYTSTVGWCHLLDSNHIFTEFLFNVLLLFNTIWSLSCVMRAKVHPLLTPCFIQQKLSF